MVNHICEPISSNQFASCSSARVGQGGDGAPLTLDQEAHGVAASILEGLDEMLTVNRLGLPVKFSRSLACTNSIENMMGTVRRVCRNVKRWRNAAMALRWTAAGMMEAAKGFRRLKAYKQLPLLRAALAAHHANHVTQRVE